MTVATSQRMTLEAYLAHEEGADTSYVLENGELVKRPTERDRNLLIAVVLMAQFLKWVPPTRLRNKTEIVVSGSGVTTRIPDLMVLTEELAAILAGASRSVVMPDMPPPALVVEVVSSGKQNEERDYRYKRSEYTARGIREYWIVDPLAAQVLVLVWVNGLYEERVFRDDDLIRSELFPRLKLTAAEVLNPE